MPRSAVRVLLRTRPTDHFAEGVKIKDTTPTVQLYMPKKDTGAINNAKTDFEYSFDEILHNAPQDLVYDVAAHDIVQSVLHGYNGTIMTYGQTGAGKTYTMSGGTDFKTRGVTPRAVTEMFQAMSMSPDKSFDVKVSYMEIYNEAIFDLLETGNQEDYSIQEDEKGQVFVRGLTQKAVRSEAEALARLFEGNSNRMTAEHALNSNSSRSHCVFTVYVKSRSQIESDGHALTSKLHFIDLAGSERVGKTGSEGQMLKEAMCINKSLSFLEQVVIALSSQSRSHVPFRQSKLTNLLKDSLGGNSKTTLIANVWCESRHLEETVSTFKFAQRMRRIQNDASVNVVVDPSAQIRILQKQIQELKAELQMQNQLHGKSHIKYDEFSEEERYELQKKVDRYLDGPAMTNGDLPDFIEIRNMREVKEYFRIFHTVVKRAETEAEARIAERGVDPAGGGGAAAGDTGGGGDDGAAGAGEVDGAGGFGVGTGHAAKGLRQAVAKPHADASPRPAATEDGLTPRDAVASPHAKVTLPDKAQAYDDFKSNEGMQAAQEMKDSAAALRDRKRRCQEVAKLVNEENGRIRELQEEARKLRERLPADDDAEGDANDEGTMKVHRGLKAAKVRYRALRDEMSSLQRQKDDMQRRVEQQRQGLIADFETWYEKTYPAEPSGAPAPLTGGDDAEKLDEGEKFDRMEEARLLEDDPNALEFYKAQKMTGGRAGRGRGQGMHAARAARQR